jgi:hypothetical protein
VVSPSKRPSQSQGRWPERLQHKREGDEPFRFCFPSSRPCHRGPPGGGNFSCPAVLFSVQELLTFFAYADYNYRV